MTGDSAAPDVKNLANCEESPTAALNTTLVMENGEKCMLLVMENMCWLEGKLCRMENWVFEGLLVIRDEVEKHSCAWVKKNLRDEVDN